MIDVHAQILVICYANICRSPAGESLLAARLEPDVRVISRGVNAFPEAGICEESLAWTRQHGGVDMIEHASTQLDLADVQASTIILTASSRQRAHVVSMRPPAQIRTFTIAQAGRIAQHLIQLGAQPPQGGVTDRVLWLADALNDQRAAAPRVAPELDDIPDPHRGGTHADAFPQLTGALQTLCAAMGLGH